MTDIKLSWENIIGAEKEKAYFQQVYSFVKNERLTGKTVYPIAKDVFNAFKITHFKDIKVVILGQDPYHNVGQAQGLAFSVPEGIKTPPSLVNIFKEQQRDLGINIPKNGCLEKWAKQGVFLLNTVLTVEEHLAHSHAKKGWETFTDNVIKAINDNLNHVVFMLWGAAAKQKEIMINKQKHLVLCSTHPSPLSAHRGFLGCGHFSKGNSYLQINGKQPINWNLA